MDEFEITKDQRSKINNPYRLHIRRVRSESRDQLAARVRRVVEVGCVLSGFKGHCRLSISHQ